MNLRNTLALSALLMTAAACGSKEGHWEGQPGRATTPIAGKIDTDAIATKAKNAIKGSPDAVAKADAAPEAQPEPLPAHVAPAAPSSTEAITPVTAAAVAGSSVILNAQVAVLRWGALEGKPWVLVGLDEEGATGTIMAKVQATKGTSAQTLPFGPLVDELQGELAKSVPRLKGQPKLLNIELADSAGKPVGTWDGGGWKFTSGH